MLCIFLATVLPDWQDSICENWHSLISCYPISSWCPQGSVIGLLLYTYTSPISTIAQSQHVSQQQCADDTQLFSALSPADHTQSISVLQSRLNPLHISFCENGMTLNPSKLVAILFGTPQRLKSLSWLKFVNVAGAVIPLSDKIKIVWCHAQCQPHYGLSLSPRKRENMFSPAFVRVCLCVCL